MHLPYLVVPVRQRCFDVYWVAHHGKYVGNYVFYGNTLSAAHVDYLACGLFRRCCNEGPDYVFYIIEFPCLLAFGHAERLLFQARDYEFRYYPVGGLPWAVDVEES